MDSRIYFDNLQAGIVQGNIAEENHYYAYGLKIATLSSKKLGDNYEGTLKNNYLYNGKELFDDADLNWYDYGFRNYDPQIGRFMQLDPLTDSYPFLTPYQYASCDPITNIDIDGLEGKEAVKGIIGTVGKVATEAAEHGGAIKELGSIVVKASYAGSKARIALSFALSAGNIFQIAQLAISIINSNPATIPAGNNMPAIDNTAINKRNYGVNQMTGNPTSKIWRGKVFTGENGGNEGRKGEVDDGDGDPTNIDALGPAIAGVTKLAKPAKWFEAILTTLEGSHELHKDGLLGEKESELPASQINQKPDNFDVRKVYQDFNWDSAKGGSGGHFDSGIDTNKFYYILPSNNLRTPDTMVIVSVPKNEKKKQPTKKGNKKP